MAVSCCVPTAVHERSRFLSSLPAFGLVMIFILAVLIGVYFYLIVVLAGNVEHLCMCLFAV